MDMADDSQKEPAMTELSDDRSLIDAPMLKSKDEEIARLRETIRKVRLLATTSALTVDGYRNALAEIRALTEACNSGPSKDFKSAITTN